MELLVKVLIALVAVLVIRAVVRKRMLKRSRAQFYDKKRVLLTGASAGIGLAIANELASYGAALTLAARRKDRLEGIAEELREKHPKCTVSIVECDVSVEEQCAAMVEEAVAAMGGLDVLILNAGIGCLMTLAEAPDTSTYRKVMDVNYFGCVYPTFYAMSHLRKSSGTIVVNSSLAGIGWTPGRTAYSASKHALRGFFNSLRCEEKNVQITTVYPGFVLSEIHDRALKKEGGDELERDLSSFMTAERASELILHAAHAGERDYPLTGLGTFAFYAQAAMGGIADRIAIKKAAAAFKNWDKTVG